MNLDEPMPLDRRKNHTIEIVVDRAAAEGGSRSRLEQSMATALKLAGGLVTISVVGGAEAGLFGKAGLRRLRNFRAGTGAALVQFQFAVWRLPRMQWPGIEIRLRSGKGNRGLVEAAF